MANKSSASVRFSATLLVVGYTGILTGRIFSPQKVRSEFSSILLLRGIGFRFSALLDSVCVFGGADVLTRVCRGGERTNWREKPEESELGVGLLPSGLWKTSQTDETLSLSFSLSLSFPFSLRALEYICFSIPRLG